MADEVQPHVGALAHVVQYCAQKLEVLLGNFSFTQTEMDGRHQIVEFNRLHIRFNSFAHLGAIALVFLENGGIMDPGREGAISRQMLLDRLSGGRRFPSPRRSGSRAGRQDHAQT
jgi:hypothetical protein